jgi:hypothetical protein
MFRAGASCRSFFRFCLPALLLFIAVAGHAQNYSSNSSPYGPGGGLPPDISTPPSAPGVEAPGMTPLPGTGLPMVGTPGPPPPTPQMLGSTLRGDSNPRSRCPKGYLEANISRRLPHLTICQIDTDVRTFCPTQSGYYACGIEGEQCCPPNTDNVCFPGSYACSVDTTVGGQARTACCIGN